MPAELRDRIVGLVDTASPPIDVESLAQQLAARHEREAGRRVPSVPPLRRRIWAFAAAFGGVLVLVGGALLAGVWLHQPADPDLGGFAEAPTAPSAAVSGWWWVALPLVVIGLGALALIGRQRRHTPPSRDQEDAMQTMEKRSTPTRQPVVEKLTRQRRWLVITLAFVLIVGAVAIGWLVAENRSQTSNVDAGVWPSEEELTPRQQYMLQVVGPDGEYHEIFNAGDMDAFAALHSTGAFHVHGDDLLPLAEIRSWYESTTTHQVDRVARTWILGEWNAAVVVEYQALPGQELLVFTFAPSGEQPLIYSVTYFPVERDSSLLAEP